MIVCEPGARELVSFDADPTVSATAEPIAAPLSKNVTVPVGTGAPASPLAANVNRTRLPGTDGLEFEESSMVGGLPTISAGASVAVLAA